MHSYLRDQFARLQQNIKSPNLRSPLSVMEPNNIIPVHRDEHVANSTVLQDVDLVLVAVTHLLDLNLGVLEATKQKSAFLGRDHFSLIDEH